jgi:putative glutathione S-transferase
MRTLAVILAVSAYSAQELCDPCRRLVICHWLQRVRSLQHHQGRDPLADQVLGGRARPVGRPGQHRVAGPPLTDKVLAIADRIAPIIEAVPSRLPSTPEETYGEYRIRRDPGDPRPLYRFTGRITEDGSSGFRAEAGRYHIYAGWFCPWAQRVTIQHALHGLAQVVTVSYVDGTRDARGRAFRETHGPDPVNGFTLLRQAYEATEPGFDGHVSVPTLWDRATGRVVSNDYTGIGIDLATRFRRWSSGADTYPEPLRERIVELDRWLGPAVNQASHRAAHDDDARAAAGRRVRRARPAPGRRAVPA